MFLFCSIPDEHDSVVHSNKCEPIKHCLGICFTNTESLTRAIDDTGSTWITSKSSSRAWIDSYPIVLDVEGAEDNEIAIGSILNLAPKRCKTVPNVNAGSALREPVDASWVPDTSFRWGNEKQGGESQKAQPTSPCHD